MVSLDFLFLPEQTAKGISKNEHDKFVSIYKGFFETVMQSSILGRLRKFFKPTNGIKVIHGIFSG